MTKEKEREKSKEYFNFASLEICKIRKSKMKTNINLKSRERTILSLYNVKNITKKKIKTKENKNEKSKDLSVLNFFRKIT